MLAAFGEERRPGYWLVRIGPRPVDHPFGYGDRYEQTVSADTKPGPHVELIGMAGRYTREHHDAIGAWLLSQGFIWWQRRRYKDGAAIQSLSRPVRLSLSFMEEILTTIDQANAHAVQALTKAIDHANKGGHTDFAAAITELGLAAEAGIDIAKGGDMRAMGDATRDIMYAMAGVAEEGLKVPPTESVHHDVVNLFNAMENVENAIKADQRARLHAALGQ